MRIPRLGQEIIDLGAFFRKAGDDYPDFVIPLADALRRRP